MSLEQCEGSLKLQDIICSAEEMQDKFSALFELFLRSAATLSIKSLTYILGEKKTQTNKTTQQTNTLF